ncbi:MAG: nucleotidyltransferase domain-containing protein [Bacteroidales bacterium]|nr:nucleotidyltransferase domain-containing protein [Bacteroidales bacterium]
MKLIRRNLAQIIALCEKHKVRELCVFGSVLTDSFNKDSDVDFTVVFDKSAVGDYFTNYFDFKFALEELLHREVDLIEYEAIRNPLFKEEVDHTKQAIYG